MISQLLLAIIMIVYKNLVCLLVPAKLLPLAIPVFPQATLKPTNKQKQQQ